MRLPLAGLALGALLSVLAVVMALAFETRSWRLLGALAGLWLVVVVEAAAATEVRLHDAGRRDGLHRVAVRRKAECTSEQ